MLFGKPDEQQALANGTVKWKAFDASVCATLSAKYQELMRSGKNLSEPVPVGDSQWGKRVVVLSRNGEHKQINQGTSNERRVRMRVEQTGQTRQAGQTGHCARSAVPEHWEFRQDPTGQRYLEVVVPQNQWGAILAKGNFSGSIDKSKVVAIRELQHPALWTRFQTTVKEVQRQPWNKDKEVVQWLWHGSKGPGGVKKTGIDLGHSKGGMWGKGCYFSDRASYSRNYANANAQNNKCMFLCQVAVGTSKVMPSNNSLAKPPDQHDSVKWGEIFVVYAPDRSFPRYEVEFKNN